jgi:hypothetical protein
MKQYVVNARFIEFPITRIEGISDKVIIPTVRGTLLLKYGIHAYYFYDFAAGRCTRVEIHHREIIRPGLSLFFKSINKNDTLVTSVKSLFKKFHYGFGFIEQIMLMTVPHAITIIDNNRFYVNLWSYTGYLDIDCAAKTVTFRTCSEHGQEYVFGSQQWLHKKSNELYSMIYSLPESMRRIVDPTHPVPCKIIGQNRNDGSKWEVWNGLLSDYLHDILVNATGQYCVVCELGMFRDVDNKILPSKVLVLDMANNRQWIISKFIVAAHAQFDPLDPDIIYFSNHNFRFIPTSLMTLLRKAIYSVEFAGPASVYKYRLTCDGPQEIGAFSDQAMFRLTNFHVFMHRGTKILAAMGYPNFIYIADALTMQFVKKITVVNTTSHNYMYRKVPCCIGTFSPSTDGEYMYVQTSRSFQIIDITSGKSIVNTPLFFNHTAANHMQTVATQPQEQCEMAQRCQIAPLRQSTWRNL